MLDGDQLYYRQYHFKAGWLEWKKGTFQGWSTMTDPQDGVVSAVAIVEDEETRDFACAFASGGIRRMAPFENKKPISPNRARRC